jgi:hypothetical protein
MTVTTATNTREAQDIASTTAMYPEGTPKRSCDSMRYLRPISSQAFVTIMVSALYRGNTHGSPLG